MASTVPTTFGSNESQSSINATEEKHKDSLMWFRRQHGTNKPNDKVLSKDFGVTQFVCSMREKCSNPGAVFNIESDMYDAPRVCKKRGCFVWICKDCYKDERIHDGDHFRMSFAEFLESQKETYVDFGFWERIHDKEYANQD